MIDLFIFLGVLAVGFVFGQINERSHFADLRRRERRLANVLAFATRYPPDMSRPHECYLVTGSVVIASDYFKQFVAGLRTLVGGRLTSYESLFDRARREAVLRMKADALVKGCRLVINLKLESSNIGTGTRNSMPMVEVLAYGTALRPSDLLPPSV